ncbi:MAG: RluA family pseudouridine synthase [Opitutaceae bacterium]
MGNDAFWSGVPFGPGVTLILADANGVAAFAKPAGILSHPNRKGEESHSLIRAAYVLGGEYYVWGDPPRKLWLLNRLDAATSGVILAAAVSELAAEIRGRFKRREVGKVYQALVFGRPARDAETWSDRLAVDKSGGRIRTGPGPIPAECAMKLIGGSADRTVSLLQLEPRTGRSHQLRVQCANRHLPIVGDQTYGEFPRNRAFAKRTGVKRLFLHSLSTRFAYAWGGRTHVFSAEAPLPAEFLVS